MDIKRLNIAYQQVYASLLTYYRSTAAFDQLALDAFHDGILTSSGYELLADVAAGELSQSAEGVTEQLTALAQSIVAQVPIGELEELSSPMVLDSWAPLARGISALNEGDGFAVVRDDDGYCVLFTQGDVAAWLARTPSPMPDPSILTISDFMGGSDDWAAVESSVPAGLVMDMMADVDQRISAVLVFSNEDYSGDPIGLVTPKTFSSWRKDGERRRRQAADLLAENPVGQFEPLPVDEDTVDSNRLVSGVGLNGPFVSEALDTHRAAILCIACSPHGLTSVELFEVLTGQRTAGVTRRGLDELPVFGCLPAMAEGELSSCVAQLTGLGLIRPSCYSTAHVLTARAIGLLLEGPDVLTAVLVGEEVSGDVR